MRVPLPKTDCADVSFVDNPMSTMDSRFRSPITFDLSKGTTRADHMKLLNTLKVAMPKDESSAASSELLEHPQNDSR